MFIFVQRQIILFLGFWRRPFRKAALRMAHNPAAAEAATLELVVQVSKRCTGGPTAS